MKIKKSVLLEALEVVRPGLSNDEVVEQSTSFAFIGDKVITYNDDISVSHPISNLGFDGAVRSQEIYEFLKKSRSETVHIEVTENEVKLKCGKSVAGLPYEAEVKLPLQEVKNVFVESDLPEGFSDDLDFIKDSCGRDMSARKFTCVHVTEIGFEATDGIQIMQVHNEGFPYPGALIPSEVVREIKKLDPVQVGETAGWLHFRNSAGTVLSCRILSDSFPDVKRHLEVVGREVKFPKALSEILDRAMVFTKKDNFMDEEVEIHIKKGSITVEGGNEFGWFREEEKMEYDGEEQTFWITPYLMKNILKKNGTCVLGANKIKFRGDGWDYVAALRERS